MNRTVAGIVDGVRTFEGAGFEVRRPFPTAEIPAGADPRFRGLDVDPFLLLDEMGPVDLAPGQAKGAPDHPHRGFETVTYVLSGEMQHKDSRGNAGRLAAGDVQWMTAGDGVVHSEMPSDRFRQEGGRMHGFQIWVNLPAKDKRMKPRYQEVPAAKIPRGVSEDGKVRVAVIAGEALGKKAVIDTRTPIFYLHFSIAPGGSVVQPAPKEFNTVAWLFDGAATLLDGRTHRNATSGQLAVFGRDGDTVGFSVPPGAAVGAEILLLGGVPLAEPVARYGPFVMNDERELIEAFEDFRQGRMGKIDF